MWKTNNISKKTCGKHIKEGIKRSLKPKGGVTSKKR